MFQTLRNPYILIAFFYDMAIATMAFLFALALRLDTLNLFDPPVIEDMQVVLPLCVIIQALCFFCSNLYRGVWKFSSMPDLSRVIRGSTLAVTCSLVAIFLYNRLESVPRSLFILDWILLIVGLGGGRFCYRLWKDKVKERRYFFPKTRGSSKTNILVVGAGDAGAQLLKEIKSNPQMGLYVVGLIDDAPLQKGRTVMGIKILGNSQDIEVLAKKYNVEKVLIAIPSATGEQIKNIVHQCKKCQMTFKMLPHLSEMLDDKVDISQLRNVKFEDLMRREPVELDTPSIGDMLTGKTIMVTGAGGSIGSELCRKIARFRPKRLICFELSELFLYQLEREFKEMSIEFDLIPIIGDVRSRSKVVSVLKQYRPQIVLHAAAYKHVPMMEMNPMEAVMTNISGTLIMAEQSKYYGVEKFVMVSTDKAVNPISIMGHTKRVAEMVCQYMGGKTQTTQYMTVRFGNVIGSNGSVLPLFKGQIENGQDLTVTHPDMERYFMSISEACELILQTATMGKGNEIFVLNMGKSIKIVDLAKEMITLSGLELGKDIDIKFIGLRPGEKFCEELFTDEENLEKTSHEKISVAKMQNLPFKFAEILSELINLDINSGKEATLKQLVGLTSEVQPRNCDSILSTTPNKINI